MSGLNAFPRPIERFGLVRTALCGALATLGMLAFAGSAHAAFPSGTNGKVVYMTQDGGDNDVFVMNADGSGKVNLTSGFTDTDYNPAFSPDGKKIVFASDRPGSADTDIWVMNADGSNPVRLTNPTRDPSTGADAPSWSPDGTRIVYDQGGDIWVMNADGSRKIQITSGFQSDGLPRWRPIL